MPKTIILLETVAKEAMQLLEEAPDMNIITGFDEVSLQKNIANTTIDAIITRGKGQVREKLLNQLPHLKVISRCGVGLDNIDVAAATKKGIKVVNAPNSNANTIAEHTISLLLMLQRNLYDAITMVKEGRWNERGTYVGDEIHGKTLGILGLGNIGKKVARIADAMGMNIIYWSAQKEDVPYPFLSLEEVLKNSDALSLHLPLTTETEHLINEKALAKMKTTALLINTARGKIIDQEALSKALANKKIGGFASDVLAVEPPETKESLLQYPNTLITAHVGSLTATTYTQMCVMTVENTLKILRGEAPAPNCIFNRNELGLSQKS
ncbi:phosphoglycerate dehydrogenase [Maribacter sp. 4U21]|uniref:2-hydroxyacid dehydrogenase n=1 Tax=Maribacter sp. 4U21 TaxID=1889779 RepID=UPI000C158F51|nr:hydroxyacid dehydrogenase [Maribacter sp. 4U21]PIB29347.1 phosphoglycerate dehydrogenase [Maribacter sp. 4U21]